jgi:hypothetical protein
MKTSESLEVWRRFLALSPGENMMRMLCLARLLTVAFTFTFAFVLELALLSAATAQELNTPRVQSSSLTITATADGERVRITAPASIVRLHLEVYGADGQKMFDQEIHGGNVFEWHLQDGQAQRLASGEYVCVVTAKSISGRITQKIGSVRIADKEATVQSITIMQLSSLQAQAIGPIEENSTWIVAGQEDPLTSTVIAHDGSDGQMIRGRGALSFRLGNFFTGHDREQMRLTEDGRLGIGTSDPRATLDVGGTIRAQNIFIVRPKKIDGTDLSSQSNDVADSIQPLTSGSGTANRMAKWIDALGTLGDSGITETSTGFVGIGTSSPTQKLHLFSPGATDNILQTFQNGTRNWSIGVNGVSDFFRISDNTAGVARLTILNNGNVGIGTTGPQYKLHVDGGNSIAVFARTHTSGNSALYGLADGGGTGVLGSSLDGTGVRAYSYNGNAVYAQTSQGTGVTGYSDTGAGVFGNSYLGKGIYGASYGGGYAGYFDGKVVFFGRVGIGVSAPTENLEVFGNIKLGSNAELQAPGGEEKLRIIRGTVAANGTIHTGAGFTVSIPETGVYIITFTKPFVGAPTITSTPEFSGTAAIIMTDGADMSSMVLKIFRRDNGALTAEAFHFIAIGTR